jgi:hypothetical protein
VLAAYREPAAILRAEDESGLFHAWYDNHAFRLIDQILGDTFVGSPHQVVQRVGRSIQPVLDLYFSVRRESHGTHGTRNCQNGYQCFAHSKFSSSASIEHLGFQCAGDDFDAGFSFSSHACAAAMSRDAV